MKLIDLLRKIGVLRGGVKRYHFTKGSEIPPEALMQDVYNAEKELVTKEDIKAVFGKRGKQPKDSDPSA